MPQVTDSIKKSSVSIVSSLDRTNYKQHTEQEYLWLNHTKEVLAIQNGTPEWVSWAAYHASSQAQQSYVICPNSLLTLFHESVHTLAMIKHSFNVIKRAVHHLNPEQIPVITFDQPLYALAKQIQWTWPDEYGEDKYVVMFGGLHIKMAVLKTLGDWLRGSGWVQALVQADLASPGIADSFLQATHVAYTRRAHQVTVVALYILKHCAYDHYCVTYSGEGAESSGIPTMV